MKSLGSLLAVALLAVPFVGAANTNDTNELFENEFFLSGIHVYEQNTGRTVDLNEMELVDSAKFTVPAGHIGYQAVVDYTTLDLTVTPIQALPDTSAESGCVLVSQFAGFGYQQSPVGVGDYISGCPFGATHPGPPNNSLLACLNSQYCYQYNYSNFGYAYMFCQFNTVTVAQADWTTATGSSLGNGVCFLFVFAFLQPLANWPFHTAYTAHYPPNTVSVALTNW